MIAELNSDTVESIIRKAADDVICPHFQNLDAASIATKSHDHDLVTIADLEAEAFLTKALMDMLPKSAVLGEEAFYKDPSIKSCLTKNLPVWIIDPIDGTSNFACGNPVFGIIVSLVLNSQTIAGWIYDPMQDRMFSAMRGEGVIRNGIRLTAGNNTVRSVQSLNGCMGRKSARIYKDAFHSLIQSGCSAHDYMAICEGTLDFRYFKSLHPWDHAAGALMITELGGNVRLMSGEDYTPIFHKPNSLLVTKVAEEWEPIHTHLVRDHT